MQITVTIPDEFAAKLRARGQSPETYVEKLITEQSSTPGGGPGRARELSLEAFNASLDALTRYSEKIPSLPTEAFSRESFYENRN